MKSLVRDVTSDSRARRWTTMAGIGVLAFTLACWLLLITVSEEFIPATLLAYGPRWVVLIPVVVGALTSLVWARTSLFLYAVSAVVVLAGVMGARWHVVRGRGPIPAPSASQLRVLSLNAQGGAIAARYLPAMLAELQPDVVDVQECGQPLADLLSKREGYYTGRYANLCILSRWPLSPPDSMPRAAFARVSTLGYGGTGLVVRYRVNRPSRSFDFVTLHLETPRKGLERLMGADGFIPDSGGVPRLGDVEGEQINARIRRMESERASVWSARFADSVPVILAGDFNMPVESSIFRQFWTRFDDAFEEAGLGFGYTKFENRYVKARIDHVLFAPRWMEARGAWVGQDVGSDHRPVIADLAFIR